jgi:ligand-binding sensor domain-containing protein/serine phosphatase RsbU (regulator of sigma subunit)
MLPTNKIKFCLLFLNTIVGTIIAQQYSVQNYLALPAISESYVYAIAQDTDAYLWIGTSDGLFRFDGINLRKYTVADSLADNFVTCCFKSKKGLWFGHMNGNLSFYDGKKFVKIQPDIAEKNSITDISANADGSVWASTFSGYLIRISNDLSYKVIAPPADGITIYAFRFLDKNNLLLGSTDGLRHCLIDKKGIVSVQKYFDDIPHERIQSIVHRKKSDGYFIGTNNHGIYQLLYNDKSFTIDRIDVNLTELISDVQCVVEDERNNLWIGTFGSGLYKLTLSKEDKIKEFFHFNQEPGQTTENIKALFYDRDENIWTGNYGKGISRLTAQTFSVNYFDKEKYGQSINSIISTEKYKWIGTEKGLLKTTPDCSEVLEFYNTADKFTNSAISTLYAQDDSKLWIGTNGTGLFCLDITTRKLTQITIQDGTLENTITTIAGFDDQLWVGTKKGACLINLKNNQKIWYTINQNGLPHNAIRQIYIDSKKQAWIITLGNTVSLVQNKKLKKIPIPSASAGITLETITEDSHGNIWIGSAGQGIFLMQADSVLNFTTKEGLFSNYCYSIAGAKNGYIWIGHRGGISRIDCNNFSIKSASKFSNNTEACDFNQNSISCDASGRIWFGANKILLCYNPGMENTRFLPPVLHITSVNINNQEYDASKRIKLNSGRYKVRFDFLGISLKEPKEVRYQYRLIGYDNDWSEISTYTSATYPGLTEGKYTFEVNAASSDGIITSAPEKIEITIKSPIWKSIWLYILIFLSIITLIFFFNKQQQHKHIAEKQLLEERVLERTLEIQRQKDEIEMQRDLINKKNIDITDSLKYARKIQSSIIPPDELLDKLLPDHFIINKPKDIVSGDFCWYTLSNDKVMVTVADCTGHGVPGAMMSILGLNALNEIIINYGITEPSRVLEFLRLKVITSLSQHSKDSPSFDGINLALCVIDQHTLNIQFSGAINNMVHIQNGKLNLVRADRIPIGVSDLEHKPFTDTTFQGKKGDVLYLYSDGFQDQFGGEKDKKFSSKRFIDLIYSIHNLPVNQQEIELKKTLNEWMGDTEQTDDITILGFRL